MNKAELMKNIKEYASERYRDGYEHGFAEGRKQDTAKANILKYLQAVYDLGFEDGKQAQTEVIESRKDVPYDAFGKYTTADEWYRDNFVEIHEKISGVVNGV